MASFGIFCVKYCFVFERMKKDFEGAIVVLKNYLMSYDQISSWVHRKKTTSEIFKCTKKFYVFESLLSQPSSFLGFQQCNNSRMFFLLVSWSWDPSTSFSPSRAKTVELHLLLFTGDFCSKSPVKPKKVIFVLSEPKRWVFMK